MDIRKCGLAAMVVLLPRLVYADCPLERAPIKTVTDAEAAAVSLLVFPATIEHLHSIPAPRPLLQDVRIAPMETTIHSVTATLVAYRLTPQSEIQLVLSDDKRRKRSRSRWSDSAMDARSRVLHHLRRRGAGRLAAVPSAGTMA